ncbi:lysophospholipid acyltransferase family protein [Chloroflexota bacterium]
MWKYYAFKIAGFTIAHFPRKIGYLIARLVADIVYILSPSLRATIADNMRHVLGLEADDAILKQAVRYVLRNAARNYLDLIRLPHIQLDDIERSISVHSWYNLEDALNKRNGVILVTAHLGSFDMAAQIFAVRSIKTTIVVESLEPPSLLRHVVALRESNGLHFVPAQSGALQIMIQALRRGETVLIVSDRDIAKNGRKSIFFGEETTLPDLAVRLAMRTGAAVVPVFNLRRDAGQYDVYFEPAINVIPGGNGAIIKNMEQITIVMEKYIKSCPEQWTVLSPIWAKEA